jgi:hypothetical protein
MFNVSFQSNFIHSDKKYSRKISSTDVESNWQTVQHPERVETAVR